MPLRITIQAFYDGAWSDAASLTVANPERVADGRCLVAYDDDYITANFDRMVNDNGQQDEVDDLVFEYVRRDLLNRILGNTDNHGRNTSIMRAGGKFRLAPIYDLAPMILDEEGITRTTKWAAERKGSSDWSDNCAELAGYTDPDALLQRLMNAAEEFRALPDLLTDAPESMRNAASIPVNNLDKRLVEWGLR
nr:HipA domain-containing protein [Pseudomonas sp. Marseille-Q3773]